MLISIPMAIYNGSDFLEISIESILNQSDPNWELICVDDGSTDNSVEIVERYMRDDNRIKLIKQPNQGGPTARRNAYRVACGDRVFTGVDQDDYVAADFVETLRRDALDSKADIVLCDWMVQEEDGTFKSFYARKGKKPGTIMNGRDVFASTFPWNIHLIGLWPRDLVNQFAKSEENSFNNYDADEFLARKIALNAETIFLGHAKYFHQRNENSLTTKISRRKIASLDTNERLLDLAIENGFSAEIKRKIILYQRNYLANIFGHFTEIDFSDDGSNGCDIALCQIMVHFRTFRANLRMYWSSTFLERLQAEIIAAKLWVRYVIMKTRIRFADGDR